jgi:hypothetical protein
MNKLITQGALNINGKMQYSVITSDIFDGWYINSRSFNFKKLAKAQEKFNEVLAQYPDAVIHESPEWAAA